MRKRKRMVQRGDFHGSERRLPWFRATTSIVGLRDFHASAFEDAWFRFRTSIHCYETTLPTPDARRRECARSIKAKGLVRQDKLG